MRLTRRIVNLENEKILGSIPRGGTKFLEVAAAVFFFFFFFFAFRKIRLMPLLASSRRLFGAASSPLYIVIDLELYGGLHRTS